jgi:hypothetical protein
MIIISLTDFAGRSFVAHVFISRPVKTGLRQSGSVVIKIKGETSCPNKVGRCGVVAYFLFRHHGWTRDLYLDIQQECRFFEDKVLAGGE